MIMRCTLAIFILFNTAIASAGDMLINRGDSMFNGWCLNAKGNTGAVTVEKRKHSGCNWYIVGDLNRLQLVNEGNSSYRGHKLNVLQDGHVNVVNRDFSGTYWKATRDITTGKYQFQNLGRSQFRNWYLNVRQSGDVTVEKDVFSGTFWDIERY